MKYSRQLSALSIKVGKDGQFNYTVPMRSNDITLMTLEPVKR